MSSATRPQAGSSIRQRLLTLALACTLPCLLVAVLLQVRSYLLEVERVKEQTQLLAISVSDSVDRQLSGYMAALTTLADNQSLQSGDLAQFREQAELFLRRQPDGANIVLSDRSGRQLVNSLLPANSPLPGQTPFNDLALVVATGTPRVSNLFTGLVSDAPRLSIDVPVFKDAQVAYVLSLAFEPAALRPLLVQQNLPPDTVVTLLDRSGVNIVRLPDRNSVGKPPSPSLKRLLDEARLHGVGPTVTLEGIPAYTAYTRSDLSGWTIAISVPRALLLGPLRTTVSLTLALGLLVVLGGIVYAARIERSVVAAVRTLASTARAVAEGQPAAITQSGVTEIDSTNRDLIATGDALRNQQQRLRLVADSLPMLISYIDADLHYRFVNQTYEQWMRVGTGNIVGKSVAEVIGPESFTAIRPYISTVLSGKNVEFESWVTYADGIRRYVHATFIPHIGDNGTVLGYFSTVADLTERRRTEERQQLLAREVDHRAKNLLAVMQSVIRLTKAPTYEAFVAALEGRVTALARAHTLLADNEWDGADLRSIVADELAPYGDEGGNTVVIEGPDVFVRADAAQPVAMAIHELATNAVKYGCLSNGAGTLRVTWSRRAADEALKIQWSENGGPPVVTPSRVGFGATLMDASIRQQMRGDVRLDWRPTGLVADLVIPASEVQWNAAMAVSEET